ncbi:hypothetical protein LVB87_10580 [Lysobacter sp. KIS68-7]|uniref:VOC family protein n=1 Tax=Lysobacter sp. KIS68-7 TaxID=2904252 RepID=UPI001E48C99B|nr:VOC family protein [Lysobacter sp. KIS68-7]UHQ18640.1 hypothetical protein LVB87_10580 [Lysobacter sp. KIS68-7]
MKRALTPMLHVPDVGATIAWYVGIGFDVVNTGEDDGELVWAMLGFGAGRVMLSIGGHASDAPRRDADLYLEVDGVDAYFARVGGQVVVVEPPHDTFYGMREFIVRDNNGFWLTFGEPVATP